MISDASLFWETTVPFCNRVVLNAGLHQCLLVYTVKLLLAAFVESELHLLFLCVVACAYAVV